MYLSEIFEQLTYGELSQVGIGGGMDVGQINEANFKSVVANVNLGLMALYKRFPIKQDSLFVDVKEGKTDYELDMKYALSNIDSTEPVKFINDLVKPFTNDIIKIERVYNFAGIELAMNDTNNLDAIKLLNMTTMKLSPTMLNELSGTSIEVVYRAKHKLIVVGDNVFNPETTQIELPYVYLEPLLYFIGSRYHNSIGMSNEFHAGNNYATKYEQACRLIEAHSLSIDQGSDTSQFCSKGWV